MTIEASNCDIDPAAVFACANSIWKACKQRMKEEPDLNLSDAYSGMDQLMREVMRIGEMFERWACRDVVFEELSDVWPYFLEEHFGDACIAVMPPDALADFDADDCPRVACHLQLPVRLDGSLCLPIDVRAANPGSNSKTKELRIQTVRDNLAGTDVVSSTREGIGKRARLFTGHHPHRMDKIIQLSLSETDIDQIIDGLCVREKAWQQTALWMRGEEPGDPSVCEECDDVEEAEEMAANYGRIIRKIVEQRDSQGVTEE